MPPTIYVIAGCNGAGKTTFAMEFLPKGVKCLRFLNADEIARGLSPLDPDASALKAGRILLEGFRDSVRNRESFAVETTLSGWTYLALFRSALVVGFEIDLNYLWLEDANQAMKRVRARVRLGGHNIPELELRRRFERSQENLLNDYLPLATYWTLWDSRTLPPKKLANSEKSDIDFVRRWLNRWRKPNRQSPKGPP
jgi:predicted ABC-type ATPase